MAVLSLVVFFTTAVFPQAQTSNPRPTFEVASVRPSSPGPPIPGVSGLIRGGPGTPDPIRFTASRVSLQRLIREAYGVDFDQIQGPEWISEEKYDIAAKLPPATSKEQLTLMLQRLLEERFHLEFHKTSREFPVYELTIAKGGSRLKENTETNLAPVRPGEGRVPADRDGFPQFAPGRSGSAAYNVNGLMRMAAQGVSLSMLTFQMAAQLGTMTGANTYTPGRIVDKTGLNGKYDFHLEFAPGSGIGSALAPQSADQAPGGGLPLIDAVEKQLGLKLTKTKTLLDVLVIEHAEKTPAEN